MSYTFNTSGGGNGTGASASFNITGVNVGDVILVWPCCNQASAPSVADGQGAYTAQGSYVVDTAVSYGSQIFSLVATAAGTHAVVITFGSSIAYRYAYWVGTPSAAAIVIATGQNAYNVNTNPITTSLTTTQPNTQIVSFAVNWGGSTTASQSGTNRSNGSVGTGFVVQDQVQAAVAAVTPSVTYTTTNNGAMNAIALGTTMVPTGLAENVVGGATSGQITVVVPVTSTLNILVKSNSTIDTGCTSSISGALTATQQINLTSNFYLSLYQLNGAAAGSHVITVTNSTANLRYIVGWCVPGSSIDVSNGNVITSSSTSANGLTTGSMTTTAADCVMECFYFVSGTVAPTVGTSPNAFTALSNPGGSAVCCVGYFNQSAAGAINPTGQAGTSGSVLGIGFSVSPASTSANKGGFFW